MLIFLTTFLPSVLILIYILKSDKFKEPIALVVSTFVLGFLLCLPAGILNEIFISNSENPDLFSFLAGFTEESLKFLALFFYIKDRNEFNEPMDAIVYGCLISLGFATFENYEYVYHYEFEFSSLAIASIRAFSAVPMHACCGIIMGYFFIYYYFNKKRVYLLFSWLVPLLIHALYNFLTNFDDVVLHLYLIAVIIFTIFCHKKIQVEQNENAN